MANREKKLLVGRKPNAPSSQPPKEDVIPTEETPASETSEESQISKNTPPKTSLAKKLAVKPPTKRLSKKPTIAIKLKPAIKKNVKLKQKMLKILKNPNTEKKKLLKQIKPRKPKPLKKTEENLPPVLEPILPYEALDKQAKKKTAKPPRIDNYAKKMGEIDNLVEGQVVKVKKVYKRKPKVDPETIDDVMDDLTSLIQATGDVRGEQRAVETNDLKTKKVVRRKKKENLENTIGNFSLSERKVIDRLDLNVNKCIDSPVEKRRHSIEKFPMNCMESDILNSSHLTIFGNVPRTQSPRSKTFPKLRQSMDAFRRYKTRSDSPARMLRNGKQRKLKDLELLDGLDGTNKRRRRNCSEFSGSEVSNSKFSGYESDSSFSDMSSLHSAENVEGIKTEPVEEVKTEQNFTDTNSNLCSDKDPTNEDNFGSPSIKVPEKSIILDIMKQTFNDIFDEKDLKYLKSQAAKENVETVATEEFYGKELFPKEDPEAKEEAPEQPPPPPEPVEQPPEDKKPPSPPEPTIDETEPEPQQDPPVQNGDMHVENGVEETAEDLAIKESILQALGLQSLKAAKEAKLHKQRVEIKSDYTGTLKTVIKINRIEKKKGRMKMTLQKSKSESNGVHEGHSASKEVPSTSWKHGSQSSDTAGAHRKSHYSNRSNMDGSSEHTSDGESGTQEGSTKVLVIPEKASSFSIHPGRICKDECSYCFGKFGLFDTPCHIAQMKSVDRQNKILGAEKHLTRDSCLCDACYRHVDRKANTPSYTNKYYKRSALVAPGPREDHCHVLGCGKVASNILRRKWIIKMRKSICEVINIDLDNPGLHSIPICDDHYSALEYLMVCAMCKRRLAKNHVHYLGPETLDLNAALTTEGIPLSLLDKPVVCKLCKYFAAIILKPPDERPENSSTFFSEYKKRLLHFNDIVPMDEAAAEEPIIIPAKDNKLDREPIKKKRKLTKPQEGSDSQPEAEKSDQSRVPSSDSTNQSRPESPSDYMVDYNTLIPSIAMECGSDSDTKKDTAKQVKKIPRPENVKQAVEISKTMKLKNDKSSDIAVQRLGSNPSISVRQLFPCEEDLPLQGHVDFGNVKERTPEGWEKCTSVIQYDMETKHLWQELQKPYGNQSSFLRHLILLEKYFRNGDLVLAPNASHHCVNYNDAVNNRLRAYDNIPASAANVQPISMLPFNKPSPQKSTSGIVTSKEAPPAPPKSTPITISQLNSPPLIPPPAVPPKPKPAGAPPGLISLHPGTNKPVAQLVKAPQSQKIKFPITKNWRPNLIPIDPNAKGAERKPGLVQVISEGKPYHITLEDYKKMCAIKKSFELKQKRMQEASKTAQSSLLKSMTPRKGLIISRTVSPKTETEETNLDKLEKSVEKSEARLNEKPPLALPKIPKSLTVIPQTVTRKPSRPSSPVLLITPKPKQVINKS